MESVGAAQQHVLAGLVPTAPETVALRAALGRVLAVPVTSGRTIPGVDNSAMDGYAVIAADVAGATPSSPVELTVVGESRAGRVPAQLVTAGTAVRIMTGAPVPAGADAVVRVEDTDDGRSRVTIRAAVPAGRNIRRAGEDMRPGDRILEPGRRLRSVDLAACAALGWVELEVHRRPRVAVLSTGDEVVEAGVQPGPAQVSDSNRVAITAAVEEAGAVPVDLGIARDRIEDLRERLLAGTECDLIITTAGVSVGDHDHVRDVVSQLGRIDLWRVAMRPGKPIASGAVAGVPFLGLPGNPVSCQVTFELFARPAILRLEGASDPHRRRQPARALERMDKPEGLEVFHRGRLVPVRDAMDGRAALPGVGLTGPQGSGILRSLVDADCLVVLPATSTGAAPGDTVEVLPIG